jgi:protein gp37
MNKTRIEWADYTWNPVTGCLHGCSYCYANRQAARFSGYDPCYNASFDFEAGCHTIKKVMKKRDADGKVRTAPYPFGFEPTFHSYKLDEPVRKKAGATIFVCSMADLFGEWVPDEWIKSVFTACEAAPQHTYMFLTKNPGRYLMLAYRGALPQGENYWWGATITNQSEYDSKGIALLNLPESHRTFFSIEPIHEPIEMGLMPNWIITGAETGNRKNKTKPRREWIEDIVRRCVAESIFMKDSLAPIVGPENMLRQLPAGITLTTKEGNYEYLRE